MQGPDGIKHRTLLRFCILELGGGKFVQILFTIPIVSPDDSQKYVDLSDRMLATVKILPTQPATKSP